MGTLAADELAAQPALLNRHFTGLKMCGIFGFRSANGDPEWQRARLSRMGHALRHRGPDDEGLWFDVEMGLALGHRRLSIIDLSPAGHQPMVSADGRHVITFNGEIYNYKAIRKDLESSGSRFRGNSDTEVLLSSIAQRGLEKTLSALNGMFAFAVWDRAERCLHLVRDRLGEKPLYYGWAGSTFLFASELKPVVAFLGTRPPISRNALALYLRHNYIPSPDTIYEGFFKLPPATWLKMDFTRGSSLPPPQVYWSARDVAEAGALAGDSFDDQEAVADLDRRLKEAVKLRMEADVPLGAFLSGGIDSSAVVAMMQTQSSRPIRTFTIGFHDANYNEAHEASKVARHLGTDHTELYASPQDALNVIPLLPKLFDEPFADSSQIPTYLVSKMARTQVTVSLSGDGGDELFGGYNRYSLTRTLMRRLLPVPALARRLLGKSIRSIPPSLWDFAGALLRSISPSWKGLNRLGSQAHKLANVLAITDPWEVYREVVSHWPLSERLVPSARPTPPPAIDDPQWSQLRDITQRMMLVDLVTYLPDDILVKVDRASMANSLESRAPFLDHTLVEFALRLPLRMKMRGGIGKWILRQVLLKYVPKALTDRPKMGFGVPLADWLRGPLRPWAEDLLSERHLASDGFLDSRKVRARWMDQLSGRQDWPHHLWDVLMFQAWLRDRDEPGRAPPDPAIELVPSSPRNVEQSTIPSLPPSAYEPRLQHRRIKVLHVISGLDTGGAEQMLLKLLERMDPESIQPAVVSMTTEGELGDRIRKLNIPLYVLGMTRGIPTPGALLRLLGILRSFSPDLLHAWMYHANLAAAFTKLLGDTTPIIWSIRSDLANVAFTPVTLASIRLCALLSRTVPSGILYNSLNAKKNHTAVGYAPSSALTIPNGFDTSRFIPSPEARRLVRGELNLHADTPLIGMVSRFNERFKDHLGFITAASLLRRLHPTVHFLLCGRDIVAGNLRLQEWIREAHLDGAIHLLGERPDTPQINAALDIATLASHQESFPNVVGEAMSCGTPVVATDVGDCRAIIGNAGLVVAPGDPAALAEAWGSLLTKGHEYRHRLGEFGRARIQTLYSIDQVAQRYQTAYRSLVTPPHQRPSKMRKEAFPMHSSS